MSGFSTHILNGNLGKDPEIRSFGSGDKVANFSIAVSDTWRDKSTGERKEKTHWHNVVVKGDHNVKIVEQFLRKGNNVTIIGSVETRKWQDQSGNDRYQTETVVGPFRGEIKLMPNARQEDRNNDDRGGDERRSAQPGGWRPPAAVEDDDSIPF